MTADRPHRHQPATTPAQEAAVTDFAATLRILEPYPGLFAYYDGRTPGKRLHSPDRNWLDDGAYSLGVASYAIVSENEALVYDTHISLDHARAVRRHLEGLGVSRIRVVLSHWHADHIAGNAVFADCEIIANRLTAKAMADNAAVLAAKNPPIDPVVMPNALFNERLELDVGKWNVELLQFDIHSADGTVLLLPDIGVLLAGDTLEDTVTYISEPEHTLRHIEELDRLAGLPIRHILPNHGSEDRIGGGGYAPDLIQANRDYLQRLLDNVADPNLDKASLADFIAPELAHGSVIYFAPYERVHRDNIAALRNRK
nr:MBL fold metallo-hydrolase [Rhizobium daejeonense]